MKLAACMVWQLPVSLLWSTPTYTCFLFGTCLLSDVIGILCTGKQWKRYLKYYAGNKELVTPCK